MVSIMKSCLVAVALLVSSLSSAAGLPADDVLLGKECGLELLQSKAFEKTNAEIQKENAEMRKQIEELQTYVNTQRTQKILMRKQLEEMTSADNAPRVVGKYKGCGLFAGVTSVCQ